MSPGGVDWRQRRKEGGSQTLTTFATFATFLRNNFSGICSWEFSDRSFYRELQTECICYQKYGGSLWYVEVYGGELGSWVAGDVWCVGVRAP